MSGAWFEVDKEGLKELQAGKPKHYVMRELVQNAWDEDTKNCEVVTSYSGGVADITVSDDSPEGFRDLRDAFVLFRKSYKQSHPEKRGRFSIGEKNAISLCDTARISTTKGTVVFTKEGRTVLQDKTSKGSTVNLKLTMKKKEYDEMLDVVRTYLVPDGIIFRVNGEILPQRKPLKTIEAKLMTELNTDGIFRRTVRKTKVEAYEKEDKAYLYELGLPVCEIDCEFSININQKIPLSIDRETVPQAYLQDVFAITLNITHEEVEDPSGIWVREGAKDKLVSPDAVKTILTKRYGEKWCSANPQDQVANDDAVAHGYRVIHGSEMSKEEWKNVKEFGLSKSSTELFGKGGDKPHTIIEPDDAQKCFGDYAKAIAKECLGLDITVMFHSDPNTTAVASFGNGKLFVNVSKLTNGFFENTVSEQTTDLIIHELAHSKGMHTEMEYHRCLTKLGSRLTMKALEEPDFFKSFEK